MKILLYYVFVCFLICISASVVLLLNRSYKETFDNCPAEYSQQLVERTQQVNSLLLDTYSKLASDTKNFNTGVAKVKDLSDKVLRKGQPFFLRSQTTNQCMSDRYNGDVKFVPQCLNQEKFVVQPTSTTLNNRCI